MEDKIADMFMEGGLIASGLKANPDITALIENLNQDLRQLEKDVLRDKLKWEISKALEAGGIPPKIAKTMTMVFANLLMEDIDLIRALCSESIILYLKCQSVQTLLRLKEMVLSGLLLWLLNDAIKQCIKCQHQIQLVIKAEDYNLSLFYLNSVTGTFVI